MNKIANLNPKRSIHKVHVINKGSVLCNSCGFCCNSLLFSEVKFRKSDPVKLLISLGLNKIKGKNAFSQPCAVYSGTTCAIYHQRPKYCQKFECRLLGKILTDSVSIKEALRIIKKVNIQTQVVKEIMQNLGQSNETLALSCRLGEIMAQPYDPLDSPQKNRFRRRLMIQSQKLILLLETHFL